MPDLNLSSLIYIPKAICMIFITCHTFYLLASLILKVNVDKISKCVQLGYQIVGESNRSQTFSFSITYSFRSIAHSVFLNKAS